MSGDGIAPSVTMPLNPGTAFQSFVRIRSVCLKVSLQNRRFCCLHLRRPCSPVSIIRLLQLTALLYHIKTYLEQKSKNLLAVCVLPFLLHLFKLFCFPLDHHNDMLNSFRGSLSLCSIFFYLPDYMLLFFTRYILPF